MLSSLDLLDRVKTRHFLRSDYALAKFLGVTPGLISKHRSDPFGLSPEVALRCAEALNLDPALVLIWNSAERAKCTAEADAWRRLACWAELRKTELKQMLVDAGGLPELGANAPQ